MKQQRKDDAVSPVIGVMLMLVVTIIIAAVITGFATDLSADTSSTPMALFDTDYLEMGKAGASGSFSIVDSFGIVHKGGDAVLLKDIQISYSTMGGMNHGLLHILGPEDVSIIGKETDRDTVITTGDVIKISADLSSSMTWINEGDRVTWTISHTKSGGVIAKGEFIALPM